MEFGIAFALGLLGSLHCAAMCGPLMLALPVPPGGAWRFTFGRIVYQLGRVTTYAWLGGVAGVIGKSVVQLCRPGLQERGDCRGADRNR